MWYAKAFGQQDPCGPVGSVKSNMVFALLHVLSIVVQNFGISLASEHNNLKNFHQLLCSLYDLPIGPVRQEPLDNYKVLLNLH